MFLFDRFDVVCHSTGIVTSRLVSRLAAWFWHYLFRRYTFFVWI